MKNNNFISIKRERIQNDQRKGYHVAIKEPVRGKQMLWISGWLKSNLHPSFLPVLSFPETISLA